MLLEISEGRVGKSIRLIDRLMVNEWVNRSDKSRFSKHFTIWGTPGDSTPLILDKLGGEPTKVGLHETVPTVNGEDDIPIVQPFMQLQMTAIEICVGRRMSDINVDDCTR